MDWEYLKQKNKERLDRLNLPEANREVKVLIFDKYTPYRLDMLPDMEIFGIKDTEGIHGTWCGQVVTLVYPSVRLYGCGYTSDIDKVIDYVIDNGIHIISCSMTFSKKNKEQALKRYNDWGGVFIAAVGNDNNKSVGYPASSRYTIGVSATNSEDCNGVEIDVTADSYWYVRNKQEGRYTSFNGTSCSTPVIAGCVCHVLAKYPGWGREDVVKFLNENSITDMKSLEQYERFFSFPNDFGRGEAMKLRTSEILFAVIHHPGRLHKYTADEVLKVHLARDFATYGYNKLIEPDGTVVIGRDPKYRGAHVVIEEGQTLEERQYWNEHALGYCMVWNGEEKEFPEVMYKALAKELYKDGFKPAQIRLHKEVDATKCPGRYFDKEKLIKYLEKEWKLVIDEIDYKGHWAEYVIDRIKELTIMGGYEGGNFKPDQPITRAEVANALYRMYGRLSKEG